MQTFVITHFCSLICFSGALDENGLIEKMNLNAIQDREICCYSISCKEKDNIDITLQWLIAHSKSGGATQ